MPRAGDPRVVVRLAPSDYAVIEAAAASAGVAVGALVRVCAVRFAGQVARESLEGRLELRRASAPREELAGRGEVPPVPLLKREPSLVGGGVSARDVGVSRAEMFRRVSGGGR